MRGQVVDTESAREFLQEARKQLSEQDRTASSGECAGKAGRFQVQPWHYLTDSNAWFMADTALMAQSLDWFNRVPLSVTPKVEDKTIRATWIAYMRYSLGWSDYRWVYGNNPS